VILIITFSLPLLLSVGVNRLKIPVLLLLLAIARLNRNAALNRYGACYDLMLVREYNGQLFMHVREYGGVCTVLFGYMTYTYFT
jgi:hypothetical protein